MSYSGFQLGDYLIRYDENNQSEPEYIAKVIYDASVIQVVVITSFINGYSAGEILVPYLPCCKKISFEEVTFYMLQNRVR